MRRQARLCRTLGHKGHQEPRAGSTVSLCPHHSSAQTSTQAGHRPGRSRCSQEVGKESCSDEAALNTWGTEMQNFNKFLTKKKKKMWFLFI